MAHHTQNPSVLTYLLLSWCWCYSVLPSNPIQVALCWLRIFFDRSLLAFSCLLRCRVETRTTALRILFAMSPVIGVRFVLMPNILDWDVLFFGGKGNTFFLFLQEKSGKVSDVPHPQFSGVSEESPLFGWICKSVRTNIFVRTREAEIPNVYIRSFWWVCTVMPLRLQRKVTKGTA